jgi:hypothetical protein
MADERPDVEALVAAYRAAREAFRPIFCRCSTDPDFHQRPETIAFDEAVDRLKAALLISGPVVIDGQRYELRDRPDGQHTFVSTPDRPPSGD